MKEEAQNALADLTYFRALDAAKKLSDQVEYFRNKKSDNRDRMVELAMIVLDTHMELVEQMRLDYQQRRRAREEQYAVNVLTQ